MEENEASKQAKIKIKKKKLQSIIRLYRTEIFGSFLAHPLSLDF